MGASEEEEMGDFCDIPQSEEHSRVSVCGLTLTERVTESLALQQERRLGLERSFISHNHSVQHTSSRGGYTR